MKHTSNRLTSRLLANLGKALAGIILLHEIGVFPAQPDTSAGARREARPLRGRQRSPGARGA